MSPGVDAAPYITRIEELTQEVAELTSDLDEANDTIHDQATRIVELDEDIYQLTEQKSQLEIALGHYTMSPLILSAFSYFTFRCSQPVTQAHIHGNYFTIGVELSGGEAYIYVAGNNSYNSQFTYSESFNWYANPNITTPAYVQHYDQKGTKTLSCTSLPWMNNYKLLYARTTSPSTQIYVSGFYDPYEDDRPCYAIYNVIVDLTPGMHDVNIIVSTEFVPSTYELSTTNYTLDPFTMFQD